MNDHMLLGIPPAGSSGGEQSGKSEIIERMRGQSGFWRRKRKMHLTVTVANYDMGATRSAFKNEEVLRSGNGRCRGERRLPRKSAVKKDQTG
jgi:hypothetical protein